MKLSKIRATKGSFAIAALIWITFGINGITFAAAAQQKLFRRQKRRLKLPSPRVETITIRSCSRSSALKLKNCYFQVTRSPTKRGARNLLRRMTKRTGSIPKGKRKY